MDDREMLQTILNAVSAVTVQLDKMEARLTAVDAELKNMGDRRDGLEAGQEALRRDVARIERKIDRQGNDIADTLLLHHAKRGRRIAQSQIKNGLFSPLPKSAKRQGFAHMGDFTQFSIR